MSDHIDLVLPVSERYRSAWSEIVGRIQARQNINLTLFVIVFSYCSILLAGFGKFFLELFEKVKVQSAIRFSDAVAQGDSITQLFFLSLGAVFLSGLSIAFLSWIAHNNISIALLTRFCSEIEKIDNPENTLKIPAWHDQRQEWIQSGRKVRASSNIATSIAVAVSLVPSIICLFLWFKFIDGLIGFFFLIPFTSIIIGLFSLETVFNLSRERNLVDRASFVLNDGQWKIQIPSRNDAAHAK